MCRGTINKAIKTAYFSIFGMESRRLCYETRQENLVRLINQGAL